MCFAHPSVPPTPLGFATFITQRYKLLLLFSREYIIVLRWSSLENISLFAGRMIFVAFSHFRATASSCSIFSALKCCRLHLFSTSFFVAAYFSVVPSLFVLSSFDFLRRNLFYHFFSVMNANVVSWFNYLLYSHSSPTRGSVVNIYPSSSWIIIIIGLFPGLDCRCPLLFWAPLQ